MNRLIKEGHLVEEINGIRCSVCEKNCTPERLDFLKKLMEFNGYEVQVQESPPPKAAKPPAAPAPDAPVEAAVPPPPQTFTVGVTDILFHAMLAIYERDLHIPEGGEVTIAYWNQEPEPDRPWYWDYNSGR